MTADLVFGKYEIQHRLAIGGMGEVFYAVQKGVPGFERAVILKSLLPELAQQSDFIDQFLDEARVAATLNHPNVVSIYEVGLWNSTYFIAMEYIRGRNLSQLIRRSQEQQTVLPPVVTATIMHDAAMGLDHAHHATDNNGQPVGIVHRDISPQNIMVRDDGVTKVVDFGIARAANRATRTATGALKGKLAYMAPEQILGQEISAKVDQFALGIVFWEMLTGRRLFKAESDIHVAKKVLEEHIESPAAFVPDLPPMLVQVVMRMLERNPEKRYESCATAASAIAEASVGLTPSGSSPVTNFMKRLGTDDLVVKVKGVSASNFVISLKRAPDEPAHTVDIVTATPMTASARPKNLKSRTPYLAVGVGLAAVAALLIALCGPKTLVDEHPPIAEVPRVDAGAVAVVPPPPPPPVPVEPPSPEAPKPGKLHLVVTPPGTGLRFDGRPLGASPQDVEDVMPNQPHYLQVDRPGFKHYEAEVKVGEGEAREVEVKLVPLPKAPTVAQPTPPPAPPPSAGTGFLTINTTPWSKVAIDGVPHGSTPISKVKLEAGSHTLVFVNEGENINKSMSVVVSSGSITKVNEKLK